MKYVHHIKSFEEYVRKDPEKFWSFSKSRTGKGSVPAVVTWGSRSAKSSHAKADVVNDFFHSICHKDTSDQYLHHTDLNMNNLNHMSVNECDVL